MAEGRFIAVVAWTALGIAISTSATATEHTAPEAEAAAILSMSGDAAYGQYLGGECATCHRSSGAAAGIPPIAGLPRDHFVLALVEYRAGLRDNEVMTTTASRLTDEEIAALAAYFAPE